MIVALGITFSAFKMKYAYNWTSKSKTLSKRNRSWTEKELTNRIGHVIKLFKCDLFILFPRFSFLNFQLNCLSFKTCVHDDLKFDRFGYKEKSSMYVPLHALFDNVAHARKTLFGNNANLSFYYSLISSF